MHTIRNFPNRLIFTYFCVYLYLEHKLTSLRHCGVTAWHSVEMMRLSLT